MKTPLVIPPHSVLNKTRKDFYPNNKRLFT